MDRLAWNGITKPLRSIMRPLYWRLPFLHDVRFRFSVQPGLARPGMISERFNEAYAAWLRDNCGVQGIWWDARGFDLLYDPDDRMFQVSVDIRFTRRRDAVAFSMRFA